MRYTDEEILQYLQQDRENGAAILMEEYAGLLWSVCRKRLEDAEDIRECVNSAFADFCLCPGKYDPEKGSLKNYLCRIAEHKAIDCHQANCRRRKAEEEAGEKMYGSRNATEAVGSTGIDGKTGCAGWAGTESPGQGDALAEHLDDALDQLEPVDSQILRMKYYDGLSYQEIAKKLGFNEAAVKMRSMRSRRKLMKILIAVLIMLLLVACVAAALRHYQFSERGGVIWSDNLLMYELDDGEYVWESEGIRYRVTDAVFQLADQEALTGEVAVYIEAGWADEVAEFDYSTLHKNSVGAIGMLSDGTLAYGNSGWNGWNFPGGYLYSGRNTIEYTIYLKASLDELGQKNMVILLFCQEEWFMDLTLVPAASMDFEEKGDEIALLNELSWTLGPAVAGENYAIVTMIQNGESEWRISSSLTGSIYGLFGREAEKITLTDENGAVYEMMRAAHNIYQLTDTQTTNQCEIYFQGVAPGKYTMTIPYLFLNRDWTSEEFVLTLPEEENQHVDCDATALFPDGSGIRITGITKTEEVVSYYEQKAGSDELITVEEYRWRYMLDYERIQSGTQFHMAGLKSAGETIIWSKLTSDGELSFSVRQEETPEEIALRFEAPEYLLDEEFTVQVTVQEPLK